MLQLRPNCELCDRDLAPDSPLARICSYECTFCADCAESVLHNVCPNCGGGFSGRPIRPRGEWRPGEGLSFHPPLTERRRTRWSATEIAALVARLRELPPANR